MRFFDSWRPPFGAARSKRIEVGDVVAYDFSAWEVTHLAKRAEISRNGHDTNATLHLLYGPGTPKMNDRQDMGVSFSSTWGPQVYHQGRVWLCSCCGHPAPCRLTIAEEESKRAATEFENRLNRMGPGICYACGEVITQRQQSMRFEGDHADFPGRSAPAFHLRRKCASERYAYAARAKSHPDGGPLVPDCEGTFIRHGDGTFECHQEGCHGVRAKHRCYSVCSCRDAACRGLRSCTPTGNEIRRVTP